MRSYQHKSTGSHQNSEVKRAWARVVLGWVTSWEVLVLHSFLFIFFVSWRGSACGDKSVCQDLRYVLTRYLVFTHSGRCCGASCPFLKGVVIVAIPGYVVEGERWKQR